MRSGQHDAPDRARQRLTQAVGGIGQGTAEGVHGGIGAAAHEHPCSGGGERDDQVDAGGGEVLGVVDHDGTEGRGRRGVGEQIRGAAHQGPGVQAWPGIQGGGGFEVEHPEVVP